MAGVSCDNASNLTDVLKGVFEKHQVHCCIDVVIFVKSFSESLLQEFSALELVVKLVIETSYELSENKGFAVFFLEVFTQVSFGISLLAVVIDKFSVSSEISGIYKTISVNTFKLVDPQLDHVVILLNGFWFSLENSLKDICQMTNIEFIMEIDGTLFEPVTNKIVHCDCGLDDVGHKFADGTLVVLGEMLR